MGLGLNSNSIRTVDEELLSVEMPLEIAIYLFVYLFIY